MVVSRGDFYQVREILEAGRRENEAKLEASRNYRDNPQILANSLSHFDTEHHLCLFSRFHYSMVSYMVSNEFRVSLLQSACNFLHQRHGPRNQPQDNERIPDPIRQCIVAVIPAGKQRRHD